MLDQRLHNVVKRRGNHYEWLSHQPVRFHFSNEFAESLVLKRLHSILAKLDMISGGPVPDRVLIRGFQGRPDDIDVRSKIARDGHSYSSDNVEERNPHLRALEALDAREAPPKSQRDEIKEKAAAWEAKKLADKAKAEMEADPAWRARHTIAGEAYLLAHYTGVPESEYQLAAARLAAVNDPAAFAEADRAFKARAEQRLAERDAAIKVELARLDAERKGLLDSSVEPVIPSAEAWQLARNDAQQLKHSGQYPHAAEEVEALHAGVHDGSIQPAEFHSRVSAIREASREAG